MKTPSRILITRTDRLGDVLMSLQAVRFVRTAFPEAAVDFLVQPALVALLGPWAESLKLRLLTPEQVQFAGYDAALCLFEEASLTSALKRNKVPVRVGNYSKLRSFFRFTHGLRQRRGAGDKNEGVHNVDLARKFTQLFQNTAVYPGDPLALPVNATAEKDATTVLQKTGVAPGEPFWIAHPGMGGSALNLSPGAYVKLLDSLSKNQPGPLLLTLGPSSSDWVMVESILDERPEWRMLPKVTLPVLAEVYRRASLVIAPSTGPLHLAHYVGAKTLGIFSPVRSHRPARWAPWGGTGVSEILVPEGPCPGDRDCLGPKCRRYPCMETLIHSPGLQSPLGSVLSSEGA